MGKQKPIKLRILEAIGNAGGVIQYHELARVVFPRDEYPNAWGYPTRGGPPGCYMVLSRAIRVHRFHLDLQHAHSVCHGTVSRGQATP